MNHTESIKMSGNKLSILILFFDSDSEWHREESNEDGDSVGSECRGNGTKHSWYSLTYYTSICLEGLTKTTLLSWTNNGMVQFNTLYHDLSGGAEKNHITFVDE